MLVTKKICCGLIGEESGVVVTAFASHRCDLGFEFLGSTARGSILLFHFILEWLGCASI